MGVRIVEVLKIGFIAGAMLAVVASLIIAKLGARGASSSRDNGIFKTGGVSWSAERAWLAALFVFALITVALYFRFSPVAFFSDYDEHDVLHYYLGAKYSDELGYHGLYPALIAADAETLNRFHDKVQRYRSTDTYEFRSREHALGMARDIKALFTARRWRDFISDYAYFGPRISDATWRAILEDRGYNATPMWNMLGRALTNSVPIERVKLLCLIDVFAVAAMFVAVYWAFGARSLAFGLIFLALGYSFRWPPLGWSILRFDWLAAIVVGAACLKKGHSKSAGVLFGYATCMRFFPAVFILGLLAKAGYAVWTNKAVPWSNPYRRILTSVPRHYWAMAGSMVLAISLLGGAALAREGTDRFSDNSEDLKKQTHTGNLSAEFCGLRTALAFENTHGNWRGEMTEATRERIEAQTGLRFVVAAVLLVLFAFAAARLEDHEAVLLGLIPFFIISTASYYYYAVRIGAVVMHAHRLRKLRDILGLLILFGIEIASWTALVVDRSPYRVVGWMGWTLAFYSVVMIALLVREQWLQHKSERLS